ncbi:MAG: calcium-binding protein, partial [Gammaproteobacteria bacterium]
SVYHLIGKGKADVDKTVPRLLPSLYRRRAGLKVDAVLEETGPLGRVYVASEPAQLLAGLRCPVTCQGRVATIVGTGAADSLTGTPGTDVIQGRGGNDTIDGRGGNDVICGGAGNDRLIGAGGNDSLSGGSGADRLDGGSGTGDRCSGGSDRDTAIRCERVSGVP